MTNLIKAIAVVTIIYGLGLGFVISDANITYALAARDLTASVAELSAYVWDATLCFGGFALYLVAPKIRTK